MYGFPRKADSLLIPTVTMFSRWQTASKMTLIINECAVTTFTSRVSVGTNIPAHIVIGGTLILVFTDDITLYICVIGRNVLNLNTENINR